MILRTDVSEWDYRNDKLDMETPTLNASTAKELITRSPLHAWQFHPRLGGTERDGTAALENGTLIHAMLLGAAREIVGLDFPDFRTKAAKEARDAARDAGQIPILASKLKFAEATVSVLRRRMADAGIVLDGQSEVTGTWLSGGDVACRCRFDHLPAAPNVAYELKTADSAHPDAFRRSIEMFGYDIAAAAYTEALEAARPEIAGAVDYKWIVVECEPPHAIAVVEREGSMIELGARRWRRAVGIWRDCIASGKWPGYGAVTVAASDWAMARETEAQLDSMGNDNDAL